MGSLDTRLQKVEARLEATMYCVRELEARVAALEQAARPAPQQPRSCDTCNQRDGLSEQCMACSNDYSGWQPRGGGG